MENGKDQNQNEKESRDMAALSYIPLLGQVIYFTKGKENALIHFHGRQGFVITIMAFIIWYFFGGYLFLELILLPLIIIGIISCEQGRYLRLPIVSNLAFNRVPWKKIGTGIKSFFVKYFAKKKKKKEEEEENVVLDTKLEHGQLRTHENVPDTKEIPKNLDF